MVDKARFRGKKAISILYVPVPEFLASVMSSVKHLGPKFRHRSYVLNCKQSPQHPTPNDIRNERHRFKWIGNQAHAIFVICKEYCGITSSPFEERRTIVGLRLAQSCATKLTVLLLENGEG